MAMTMVGIIHERMIQVRANCRPRKAWFNARAAAKAKMVCTTAPPTAQMRLLPKADRNSASPSTVA
jgi:hypothetical protein